MINKHPTLESITPNFGQSFTMRKFNEPSANVVPAWHFHPELEIAFIASGNGKRHVGNHISYYKNGDLIFLGPNLPHYGFTDRFTGASSEIVIQLKQDFLGTNIFEVPEMEAISGLFERSKRGLVFYGNTKFIIGERLQDLFHMTSFEKLIELLKMLHILAISEEYTLLNASDTSIIVDHKDSMRIDIIFKYVRQHFQDEVIPLSNVAPLVNMTVPSFCRYFKKHTNKTFTQFVNEFRIVHATKLLSETEDLISTICFDCGFNNFSHFNRYFRKITGKSPSQYRKELNPVPLT